MSYVLHYGDMRTGWVIGTLSVDTCRVTDTLRDHSTLTAHVPIGSAREVWGMLSHGPQDMWLLTWDDEFTSRALAGGPILPMAFDSSGISIQGAGLWWVFRNRILVHHNWTPTGTSSAAAPPFALASMELGTIQKYLLKEASQTANYNYANLPIDFDFDADRGGSHTRTYQPYDLVTVAQRVEEIGAVDAGTAGLGGPDWGLYPVLQTEVLPVVTFRFMSGTDAQPKLFGDATPLILDATAPGQRVIRSLTGLRDGSKRATRVFSSGAGTEGAKVIKLAEQSDHGSFQPLPSDTTGIRIDDVVNNDSANLNLVQEYADDALLRRQLTPSALTVEVAASFWWANDGKTGQPIRLIWDAHPILGDIDITTRVMAWEVDISKPWVRLTLADTTVQI